MALSHTTSRLGVLPDGDYLLDNDAWPTNLLSCKLVCMAGRAGSDDPSPIRAAYQPVWVVQPCPSLQHIHHPDPAPELQLTRLKRKGLTLAPHPVPTPRRPNLGPQSPQAVKTVMTVTQHPKRAASLKKEMRQTPTVEPWVTAKAQMVAALMGKVLVAAAKFQMLMARKKTPDGETNESSSEAEGSDTESSSSSSESDDEILTKATQPVKKAPGSNPNTSQMLSLPDLDGKDSKWKIQRCRNAHLLDEKSGKWQDHMISKGHNEWNMHDTMICDHADPCKEAKFPGPIGPPLEYMKHCGVFDAKKTNEYDLCCFYQVGLSGDLPDFPSPHKPATHEWVSKFLLKARSLGWPNLIVAHPWDSGTAVCLLQELHVKDSL